MLSLVIFSVFAFLVTLAITPVCRAACRRLGWLDYSDQRKVHRTPVPRTGGIAIFLGYAAALAVILLSPAKDAFFAAWGALPGLWALAAVLAVFATGLLDDTLGLKPWMKILGQILAASLACYGGVQINALAGFSIANTWWHVPLTIFWLVGCANAFNLIDGLDGLAVGVGLFATATAFLSALLYGNFALALATAPLLGALLGFLPYNFSPASIFMGDCGSLTVGFLLGCFGVIWSQKSATLLGVTAPLIALALPLLDTALAIARRFLRHQPIFVADSGHIHHRLLARGLTPRRVAYVLYAFAGIVAGFSLLLSATEKHMGGVVLVAFCAIVWFAIHYLRYEEFEAARRLISGGMFRRTLNAHLSIRRLEQTIQSARTLDECWAAIVDTSRSLGFSEVSLQTGGRHFTARLTEADPKECWNLRIPLNGSGGVSLSVPFRTPLPPATVGPLAASLRSILAPKLYEFEFRVQPLRDKVTKYASVIAANERLSPDLAAEVIRFT